MPEFLRITDFQDRYSVSRSTVYRLADRGEIDLVKIGRAVRITRASADRWFCSLVRDHQNDG